MSTTETAITVNELKQWLSGVEDMQEPDWFPSQVQWKKIRDKIFSLVETVEPAAPARPAIEYTYGTRATPGAPAVEHSTFVPIQQPTSFDMPIAPAAIPAGVPMSSDNMSRVTTPNIDTSLGKPYTSAFA